MKDDHELRIALAGNPNVGKSTVFNALTGMDQHTGNWSGKTVSAAEGHFSAGDRRFVLVDIPGLYSLRGSSAEEKAARDEIVSGGAEGVVVVCDAGCLQRNLSLALQVMEVQPRTLICVNLLDEAASRGIAVDTAALSRELGVPVVGVVARSGQGLDLLREEICRMMSSPPPEISPTELPEELSAAADRAAQLLGCGRIHALRALEGDPELPETPQITALRRELSMDCGQISDEVSLAYMSRAGEAAQAAVTCRETSAVSRDRRLDRLFLSPLTGIPVMILLLGAVLWLTITGANYPSELLSRGFSALGELLSRGLFRLGAPSWLEGALIQGVYRTVSWVVSVMLPPMAIFFPMFTLLEDFGYLPRMAFSLDGCFRCAGACGKQAITMAMGLGCNACGVTGCRTIDSPRERLIGILTNSFMPCNGRFPVIIAVIAMFFSGNSLCSAGLVLCCLLLGALMTLAVSRLLSKTVLKGETSAFTLELPPYRRPQIGRVLVRSLLDRTVFVLGRACAAAAPCGLLIWCMANISPGGESLLSRAAELLAPLGELMGLDGAVLLAFILGFPANEIVLPIILMTYLSQSGLAEAPGLPQIRELLILNGWGSVRGLCMVVFTLFHFPCATTCLTIKKETGSLKWTALSIALPTAVGGALCVVIHLLSRLF